MVSTTSSTGWVGPRDLRSAITSSALRVLSLRPSIADRPSWIDIPSQIASVIGTANAAITTSRRSRGEIRSQKSRALSESVDIVTSHAWRGDRQAELLDALGGGVGRTTRDVLEAWDLLELGDQQVHALAL